MSKRFRVGVLVVVLLLLAIGTAALAIYVALRHVPEFYREALAAPADRQKLASDRMLQRSGALASDLKRTGRWHAVFTAEEINGWLAVDLVQNYPDTLPPELCSPRVRIEPDRVRIACRFQQGNLSGVLSLIVEPYVVKPNVVALRVRSARAGAIPIPLGRFLGAISAAARRAHARIEWRQAGGDPVAIFSLDPPHGNNRASVEAIRLGDDKISLAGRTEDY